MILTSTKEMNDIDQANRLGYRLAGGRVFNCSSTLFQLYKQKMIGFHDYINLKFLLYKNNHIPENILMFKSSNYLDMIKHYIEHFFCLIMKFCPHD